MDSSSCYLNHAGTSWPKPAGVVDAVNEAMHSNPMQWPERFDAAHQSVAGYFGVDCLEQILLTPGCTSALAVAVADVSLQKHERVLTSQWEHHALHRPLQKLAAGGVLVESIPPEKSSSGGIVGPLDLNWLEDTLNKENVGLVALTAACNVTGDLLPYEEVIELSHRFGAMVLIDVAQVVGWLRLDLGKLGADLVAFGGHKGLQGPWGIGGLYVSERSRMECVSAACGLPSPGQDAIAPRPGYCDVGSVDQFALAGLHSAVEVLQKCDEDLLKKARHQTQRLQSLLVEFDEVRQYGVNDITGRMPTIAFSMPNVNSSDLASCLKKHGVIAGSGLHCAPVAHQTLGTERAGLTRLSVGLRQSDEEIDIALKRIRSALIELRASDVE